MKRHLTSMALIALLFVSIGKIFADNSEYKNLQEKIPADPKIKIGTLENGIKYYIKYNPKPENRMTLRMPFKCGSNHEDDDQKGLAHFIEHMAFNGTKNFPKDSLINFLEKTGVRFGADLNAHTWYNETVYKLQVPTDDEKLIAQGFQVLEDWAHNISFDHEEIDKERGVVVEEWRLRRGAYERTYLEHLEEFAAGSRYVDRYTIGDTAILKNAPYDVFKRYYKDWYRPDMFAVIVVGDIDINKAEGLVKKHFSNIKMPANPREYKKYKVPFHKELKASVAIDPEMTSASVTLAFKHDRENDGTYGFYRQDIVVNLFTQMLNQRLADLTKTGTPPFQYAYVYNGEAMGFQKAMNVAAGLNMEDIMTGYNAVLTELFRAYQNGFTDTELERAKAEMLRMIDQYYNEREKTESVNYAEEYIRNFFENESIPGIESEQKLYHKWMPGISADEVMKTTRDFLKNENMVIMLSSLQKEGLNVPTEKELLDVYNQIRNSKLEPYVDEVSDAPLFSASIIPGKVTGEKVIEGIGSYEWKLSNGATVIVKKTDFKEDEILLSSYQFGGSSISDDAKWLSAEYAARIANRGGVGDFSQITLEKKLAGKLVNVSPSIWDIGQGMYGSCSPEDIETMMQLINLYFNQPRKDKEALEAFMTIQKQRIRDSKNSPYKPLIDSIQYFLSNYDERSKPMTEEMLDKINLDEAYNFYKSMFSNANGITFFFVGNIDVVKFRPMVEKYIGSLPSKEKAPNYRDRGVRPPKTAAKKEIYKGVDPKSYVYMVMNGDFEYGEYNRHVLKSLCEVANIKLREVMREDKSGVYGVGCYPSFENHPYQGYTITFSFGCDPLRVEELIGELKKVIQSMKDELPEEEYMTKIIETQKRTFETSKKENRFWLNNLRMYHMNGMDMSNIEKIPDMADRLTKQQIKDAANKYFNFNSLKQFILYPEDKTN